MSDSPHCHGHEVRSQSKIAPPTASGDWRFCIECYQHIDENGLEPGEDFGVGDLPTPGGES